jgi:hypothetical protein
MLGCHDLEGRRDPRLKKEVFEFNVTVNKFVDGSEFWRESFQITEDGTQKFYNLTGNKHT